MTAGGQVPAQVIPAIDLQLRPSTQNVGINETARVGLYAVSNSPFSQSFVGVEIVLSWDPSRLQLLGAEDPSPSPWSGSAFPASDAHGLNEFVPPQDGTGLWRAFGFLGSSVTATPSGTLITTFRFKPKVLSSGTLVEIPPEGGDPITSPSGVSLQETIVLDYSSPGFNSVGNLLPTTLTITEEGGDNPTPPILVFRSPPSGQVINTVSGIRSIVVQFDRPVSSSSSIQVTGTNNAVGSGTLQGAGTNQLTLQFPEDLPDQDRYTVVVSADGLFDQWQFRVLLGDCNQDGVVNIFDLGEMRAHLRNGTFDANCNIKDTDSVINIFDLGFVRTALRNGASAP